MHDARLSNIPIRRACTEGTRQAILSELLLWARDPENKRIFWLNGMAGTGKTTIAYSFCEVLKKLGMLGASFFCSRNAADCSAAENILASVAYQLSLRSTLIMNAVITVLDEHDGQLGQNIEVTFDRILVQPLKRVCDHFAKAPLIVVIDALDECSNAKLAEELVGNLSANASSLPIKFFVTSRPEPYFHGVVYGKHGISLRSFHLHDVEKSLVREDIRLFVQEELGHLGHDAPVKWGSLLKELVNIAGCLFIYAATASKYILDGPPDADSRTERLEEIVSHKSDSEGTSAIDGIYGLILDTSFKRYGTKKERKDLSRILQAIVCLQDPLSIRDLSAFIGTREERIKGLLSELHSVLSIPQDGPIQTLHASFPDYLSKTLYLEKHLDSSCSCIHADLTKSSFHIMHEQLRFNITNFHSSYEANNEKDLTGIVESIGVPLAYASRFWGYHLLRAKAEHLVLATGLLESFTKEKILFWLEVLSVLRAVGTVSSSLGSLIRSIIGGEVRYSFIEQGLSC
jgi:hypothetical protein